jgi:hypothetical protein
MIPADGRSQFADLSNLSAVPTEFHLAMLIRLPDRKLRRSRRARASLHWGGHLALARPQLTALRVGRTGPLARCLREALLLDNPAHHPELVYAKKAASWFKPRHERSKHSPARPTQSQIRKFPTYRSSTERSARSPMSHPLPPQGRTGLTNQQIP